MADVQYEAQIRARITQLRLAKNVSEHRMSLDLEKSGSYIRGITSGVALPSLKELLRIIEYFEMTPAEFFAPMDETSTPYHTLCETLRTMDDASLEKVIQFVSWIKK